MSQARDLNGNVAENWRELPEEERARLRAHVPINENDDGVVCTPNGWRRWLKHRELSLSGMGLAHLIGPSQ